MSVFYHLFKVISLTLTALALMFFYPNSADTHSVKDAENIRLNFTVLSDAHIEGNNPERYDIFTKILYDVKNTDNKNDALVMLGDNTMNGQHIESIFFYGLEKVISPADRIINVMGNHDTGNGTGVYKECLEKYIEYNNVFFDADLDKQYYYTEIDGYYFIVLGSETDSVDRCSMSDEQYFWLESLLTEAAGKGKPVFVFNHHPYFLIDCTYSVEALLNSYEDVFYFFGHTHWPLNNYETFTDHGNYVSVNLPRCTDVLTEETENDDYSGIGAQVEVYDDEIIIRMRNFYDGEWAQEYERTYSLAY